MCLVSHNSWGVSKNCVFMTRRVDDDAPYKPFLQSDDDGEGGGAKTCPVRMAQFMDPSLTAEQLPHICEKTVLNSLQAVGWHARRKNVKKPYTFSKNQIIAMILKCTGFTSCRVAFQPQQSAYELERSFGVLLKRNVCSPKQ